jgi:hypothetical protein
MTRTGTSVYPASFDSFDRLGTTNYEDDSGYEHQLVHNEAMSGIEKIQATVGTSLGTSVLKNVLAGQFVATTAGTETLTNKTLTTPLVDVISEKTLANGVTIDGVSLKDGDFKSGLGAVTGYVGASNLADDTAISFTPTNAFGVVIMNARNTTYSNFWCIAEYRTIATNFIVAMAAGANVAVTTGALAGTTGTDGNVTLSVNSVDGKMYLENRRGGAISLTLTFLGS